MKIFLFIRMISRFSFMFDIFSEYYKPFLFAKNEIGILYFHNFPFIKEQIF